MQENVFFNSINSLSDYSSFGLVQNVDYSSVAITVRSGEISNVSINFVPALDEVVYTTGRTSFTAAKPSITNANFQTLRAEIEFKEELRNRVANVRLVADIPNQLNLIENSITIRNQIVNNYTFNNNRLTIPITNGLNVVHFSINPTHGGEFTPSAFVEFTLDGTTIRQPIGTARFFVEELTINVPSLVSFI